MPDVAVRVGRTAVAHAKVPREHVDFLCGHDLPQSLKKVTDTSARAMGQNCQTKTTNIPSAIITKNEQRPFLMQTWSQDKCFPPTSPEWVMRLRRRSPRAPLTLTAVELNSLVLANQRRLYRLLFECAVQSHSQILEVRITIETVRTSTSPKRSCNRHPTGIASSLPRRCSALP